MASSKQVVGNPTPRVEGELKVSGAAKYAVDITVPGMLWGKLLRSPIASGKIKSINTSQAEALPGVYAVVTGEDCAGLKIGRRLYDMPILADGEVRPFLGQPLFVETVAGLVDDAHQRGQEFACVVAGGHPHVGGDAAAERMVRDIEVSLNVRLRRRAAIDLLVVEDERQVLPLTICKASIAHAVRGY